MRRRRWIYLLLVFVPAVISVSIIGATGGASPPVGGGAGGAVSAPAVPVAAPATSAPTGVEAPPEAAQNPTAPTSSGPPSIPQSSPPAAEAQPPSSMPEQTTPSAPDHGGEVERSSPRYAAYSAMESIEEPYADAVARALLDPVRQTALAGGVRRGAGPSSAEPEPVLPSTASPPGPSSTGERTPSSSPPPDSSLAFTPPYGRDGGSALGPSTDPGLLQPLAPVRVPEPGSLGLIALGLLAALRRRAA